MALLAFAVLGFGVSSLVWATYTVLYTQGGFEAWWNFHYMGTNGVVLTYIPAVTMTAFGTIFMIGVVKKL